MKSVVFRSVQGYPWGIWRSGRYLRDGNYYRYYIISKKSGEFKVCLSLITPLLNLLKRYDEIKYVFQTLKQAKKCAKAIHTHSSRGSGVINVVRFVDCEYSWNLLRISRNHYIIVAYRGVASRKQGPKYRTFNSKKSALKAFEQWVDSVEYSDV